MQDRTHLWTANTDILVLLRLGKEIGWKSLREQSIQRILYISEVLYSFVYPDHENIFQDYRFSATVSGPFSEAADSSIVDLKARELIAEDVEGNVHLLESNVDSESDPKREDWLRTIIYILGLYGESKIFNFTIRDPLYSEAVKTNAQKDLDTAPENLTIKVLNDFKAAFEETLDDTSAINKKEYLELYFEFVFSTIIQKR